MFINITDSETGNNKGSSAQLVNYLEKENRNALKEDSSSELWFNEASRNIYPQEVRVKIDNNIAKLGRNDAKFFLVNISPSQKEIAFLKERYGEQGAEDKLKEYAVAVMDAYAQNFKRSGIESSKDLLWYAKLERNRYYSHNDSEVKNGTAKVGEPKEGEQMHVQVIVSRKDKTNKIKLSPMNNSRGSNKQHSAKIGQFNRVAFKNSGEQIFDEMFGFDRLLKESVNYALTMKNGTTDEKRAINILDQLETDSSEKEIKFDLNMVKTVFTGNPSETVELADLIDNSISDLFSVLFSSDPSVYENDQDQLPHFKKKGKQRRRS